jgi:RNA polymerase sigma-70 factor (ECF subfamily)
MSYAFRAALEQWPTKGVPENPRAWLVPAGRFMAIDKLRRDSRYGALDDEAAGNIAAPKFDKPENIKDENACG